MRIARDFVLVFILFALACSKSTYYDDGDSGTDAGIDAPGVDSPTFDTSVDTPHSDVPGDTLGSDVPRDSPPITGRRLRSGEVLSITTQADGNFLVTCEGANPCHGVVAASLSEIDACNIMGSACPNLGGNRQARLRMNMVNVGDKRFPFDVYTEDGRWLSRTVTSAFYIEAGDTLVIRFDSPETPVSMDLVATWESRPRIQRSEVGMFLRELPQVSNLVEEEPNFFTFTFEQPVNHYAPSRTFRQRTSLRVENLSQPVIFSRIGYEIVEYTPELVASLQGNSIKVEERFFGESIPPNVTEEEWTHVMIAQAAADHHALRIALAPLFGNAPWIGTGHSKGGMTAVYHHRFFPQDMAGTVAYVAPISFQREDPRYIPFLDQIGTDECRENLRALIDALHFRLFTDMMPFLEAETQRPERGSALFEIAEDLLEVTEWGFWQSSGLEQCDTINASTTEAFLAATPEQAWSSSRDFFSYVIDREAEPESLGLVYSFQALYELGYQSHSRSFYRLGLQFPGYHGFVGPPTAPEVEHRQEAMVDIDRWVQSHANNIVFVYGEHDPWTGGAFSMPRGNPTVYRVTAPDTNHGALIQLLTFQDQQRVNRTLQSWMEPDPRGLSRPIEFRGSAPELPGDALARDAVERLLSLMR